MSTQATAVTGPSIAGGPAPRGQTVITPRALAAVAGKAASEVEGIEAVSRPGLRRFLTGLLPGGTAASPASASVATGSTALELRLAVIWPRPLAEAADEARRHVRARVEELTGYSVSEVDMVVDRLPDAPGVARRQVR